VSVISNGADFDDFDGLEYRANGRFRVTHAGAMFGKRDPRPFLTAFARADLADSVVRFVGDFREADREWAEGLGLGERLELHPYVPRRRSLALQRDSEVNLLLMPEVPGRGSGVIAAKVFEYLAAERPILAAVPPDGATAAFVRDAEAGVIVAPDDVDAIESALRDLHTRWQAGSLAGTTLPLELRTRLDRRTRAEELARLLRDLSS
jgi:glycosyltransferase involved in cell wall biosynthesis